MLPCFISSRKVLALRSRRSTACATSAGRNTGRQIEEIKLKLVRGKQIAGIKLAMEKAKDGNRDQWDKDKQLKEIIVWVWVPGKDKKA